MMVKCNIYSEYALKFIISNMAEVLNFNQKVRIAQCIYGDLTVLNDDLVLTDVFAKGKIMMKDSIILRKDMYE